MKQIVVGVLIGLILFAAASLPALLEEATVRDATSPNGLYEGRVVAITGKSNTVVIWFENRDSLVVRYAVNLQVGEYYSLTVEEGIIKSVEVLKGERFSSSGD
jgi:hypothetical protein